MGKRAKVVSKKAWSKLDTSEVQVRRSMITCVPLVFISPDSSSPFLTFRSSIRSRTEIPPGAPHRRRKAFRISATRGCLRLATIDCGDFVPHLGPAHCKIPNTARIDFVSQEAAEAPARALLRNADAEHKGNDELFFVDKKGNTGRRSVPLVWMNKAGVFIVLIPGLSNLVFFVKPDTHGLRFAQQIFL